MAEMVLGKQIYRSLDETIKPEHTGLIIVDIQNDFCKEEGHWAKQGKDISHVQKIIPGLVRLIAGARKAGVPIIYLQNAYGGSYYSPSFMAHMLKRWDNESQLLYTLEGTWGHQIIDEIKPEKTDFVVKKHRPSGFFGTDLDLILRNINRKTIIVTGCVTEGCVESTARDGVDEGLLRDDCRRLRSFRQARPAQCPVNTNEPNIPLCHFLGRDFEDLGCSAIVSKGLNPSTDS